MTHVADLMRTHIRTRVHGLVAAVGTEDLAAVLASVFAARDAELSLASGAVVEVVLVLTSHLDDRLVRTASVAARTTRSGVARVLAV